MKVFNILILFLILFACKRENNEPVVNSVDPTIGGVGVLLQPTRPTVHLPNQMIRVYPMKNDQLDDRIRYFPLINASHRTLWIFGLMPWDEAIMPDSWTKPVVFDRETTTPYYYAATLGDNGCRLEFAPEKKSGVFRIDFRGGQPQYLRLTTLNSGGGAFEINGQRTLSGYEEFNGMKAWLYAQTDADITESIYRDESAKDAVMLGFGEKARTVVFRYGISFISEEQAKQNLLKEIPDNNFEKVKQAARQTWDNTLSQIRVEGGAPAQRRVFYTALYRCYERMVDINEYGRYYSNYDHRVHESARPFYVDNWLWDLYLAYEPLHTILNPQFVTDQIRSYVLMYEQGGTIPSFALLTGDWPAMTGNYAAAWFADAWYKGLRDFDLKTAYEGVRKNSLDQTLLPWNNGPRTPLDDFYNEHGYMPGLPPGQPETVPQVDTGWEKRQSVAVTTVNSYADWCIAQLAGELNLAADRELFLNRAAFYRNVFRTGKGFMWPKDSDGNWIEPFDPRFAGREYFTENNAYTFNWDVKHDLNGLFRLMGGREQAEAHLDHLFREGLGKSKWDFWTTQPDATGMVGQFPMGNEPAFHIPYIYNYLGSPWKTQKRIRMLLDAFFTDNLFGIPGDEDGGGMSAFVVFSMMGFFPVTPGIPVYVAGSPVFDKVTIQLPNGKTFTIVAKNNSAGNKYIQSASLNGQPLTKPWFAHTDLAGGGTLEFIMGDSPNKQWGSRPEDAPPSALDFKNR
ncbi:MAG: glycoside hydrolase family 92 protein [Dysgonamonadaceae bacterium]|jgi:predicted alpha-1,2-mannosidase|nr:glycoside hydrolase family 92 protein [Dysgonamonadaceae bacterium]